MYRLSGNRRTSGAFLRLAREFVDTDRLVVSQVQRRPKSKQFAAVVSALLESRT